VGGGFAGRVGEEGRYKGAEVARRPGEGRVLDVGSGVETGLPAKTCEASRRASV
jgi:hypothetical protein